MYHDPPSGYYLGNLAAALSKLGIDACVVGRGATAFMYLADPEEHERYGRVLFHQPLSGPSLFIRTNGDTIGPVSDIEAAAKEVHRVVNSGEVPDGTAREGRNTPSTTPCDR